MRDMGGLGLGSNTQLLLPRLPGSRRKWLTIAAIALLALIGFMAWYLWPVFQYVAPSSGQIAFEGAWLPQSNQYMKRGDQLFVPFDVVNRYIDPHAVFDRKSKQIIITTQNKVIRLATQQLRQWVNNHPVQLHTAVVIVQSVPFVSLSMLEQVYPIQDTVTKSGTLLIDRITDPTIIASANRSDHLRLNPAFRSPFRGAVQQGEALKVYNESDGWDFVRSTSGMEGYIASGEVALSGIKPGSSQSDRAPRYIPQRIMGEPLSITWEAVYSHSPDPNGLTAPAGVNVVAPTWFQLAKDAGHVDTLADPSYTAWAHQHHLQVWGLMTNQFDATLTHTMLSDAKKRNAVETAIVLQATMDQLDGINIDFENVRLGDRDRFTQFLRELTPLLHEAHITLSVDVTTISNSPDWSECFDRTAIAHIVDYVVLMAYDEHTDGSDPGSVASMPWTRQAVEQTVQQVPADRLILGVPLYSRLWTIKDGKVTSISLSLKGQAKWINEHHATITYDHTTRQHFVTVKDGGTTYEMWVEDDTSLKERVQLADQNGLAGVASWARSLGSPDGWTTMERGLGFQQTRPLDH